MHLTCAIKWRHWQALKSVGVLERSPLPAPRALVGNTCSMTSFPPRPCLTPASIPGGSSCNIPLSLVPRRLLGRVWASRCMKRRRPSRRSCSRKTVLTRTKTCARPLRTSASGPPRLYVGADAYRF